MKNDNRSDIISLDTLSIFKMLYKAIKSKSFREQAEIHTKIYDSAINDVENKMFEKIDEIFIRVDKIERRFEKALLRNTVVNIVAISTPIAFGFAGVIWAILHSAPIT